jgi:hypothetical protein
MKSSASFDMSEVLAGCNFEQTNVFICATGLREPQAFGQPENSLMLGPLDAISTLHG